MSTHHRVRLALLPTRLVGAALATLAAGGLAPTGTAAQPAASITGQGAAPAAGGATTARDRWADSVRRLIDAAVPTADRGALASARVLLDRALAVHPHDGLLLHYAGYVAYRDAVLALARDGGTAGRGAARGLLERADSLLERSATRLPLAETHALRSSVLGMQIATSGNPAAGMWLGPRSSAAMDEALRLGPRNPRVWLLRGIAAYSTPRMWGGGAERAREYLLTAAALASADRPPAPLPAWGAAEVQLWLGRAWLALDRPDSARAAYARARALEPENQWLTRVLIPEAERAVTRGSGAR